ncbi:MAG: ankyrin repeat domain-containing protein [Clostridiaceae bacterium]
MKFSNLIFNNDIEGVKRLIEGGCSPNEYSERGETPICLAIALENKEIVEILLNAGADINLPQKDDLGYTPLICAIRNCRGENLEMVKFLVEKGADIEKGDSRNGTALLHSCITAYKNILLYLISKGAKVDCLDIEGQTPLHYICKFSVDWSGHAITQTVNGITEEVKNNRLDDHFEIFKILIENKADVNKVTDYGFTPLHLASEKGGKVFINPLVEAGADVNAVDKFGFTPLVGAVLAGNISVINLFMDFGVDRLAKVTSSYDIVEVGDTAVDVARKKNRGDMVEVLTTTP